MAKQDTKWSFLFMAAVIHKLTSHVNFEQKAQWSLLDAKGSVSTSVDSSAMTSQLLPSDWRLLHVSITKWSEGESSRPLI